MSVNHCGERKLLKEAEAARYLNVSCQFLRNSRMNGRVKGRAEPPPYIRAGRMIRYCIEDLDAWIERHRCEAR